MGTLPVPQREDTETQERNRVQIVDPGGRLSHSRWCFQAVNATIGDPDLPMIGGKTGGTTTEVSGSAEPVPASGALLALPT